MNWNWRRVYWPALALNAAVFLAAQPAQFADLVMRGGKVVTMDGEDRVAEAVAVNGNRITAIGSNAEIGRLAGPRTQVIELNGRTL